VVNQKRSPGNSYYLRPAGRVALRTLIDESGSSEPSLACRPIGTYILPKIIKQYQQDRDQEAVAVGSWARVFRYYYDKLSLAQQQKFVRNNYEGKSILYGNYTPEYLTTQHPYPQAASVNQTISSQQIAGLMWNLDYSKPNQEQKFKDTIDRSNATAIAFSLAACDPHLQDWLVYRLVRSLKRRKWLEIDLTYEESKFSVWNLMSIWQQIAEQIEDPTESNDFARYVNQRFVVIKVRKAQLSHQEILIREFWHPLLQQLNSSDGDQKNELRLLLFIVNDGELQLDASYQVICLEPILSIDSADIIRWAESPGVSTYLEKDKGRIKFKEWKRVKVPTLDYSLPKLFKTLIRYINPEAELDDVAKSWIIGGS
jgi:inactive STAND